MFICSIPIEHMKECDRVYYLHLCCRYFFLLNLQNHKMNEIIKC